MPLGSISFFLWLKNDSFFDSIIIVGKFEKLIAKIMIGNNVSYQEAENVLLNLGFHLKICGSHHVFRKPGYQRTISIKKRPQLIICLSNK